MLCYLDAGLDFVVEFCLPPLQLAASPLAAGW